jgi:protein deglycase
MNTPDQKRVLCVLVRGFEEIEAIAPIDLLRRAGAQVIVASLTGEMLLTGRSNVTVRADAAIADLNPDTFDLLLLPGGPGFKLLRADGRPRDLASAFVSKSKPVAAICAAPTVLKDAGLLAGKRFTSHFSVNAELSDSLAHESVVEDGLVITARGAGAAIQFGLLLVKRLFGQQKADEVAQSIMV